MADSSGLGQPQMDAEVAADFTMEFVPRLPGGRAIAPLEVEGAFAFAVAERAMTQQCLDEMIMHLRRIVRSGSWLQNWPGRPADTTGPAPERQHAEAPAAAVFDMELRPSLPGGAEILPDEKPGRFVWLVRDGAMTPRCFDELRTYLLAIVGGGQWSQNWDGHARPTN